MKKSVLRFPSSSMLIALLRLTSRLLSVFIGVNLWLLFVFSSTVHASPQPSNDVHFACLSIQKTCGHAIASMPPQSTRLI